MKILLLLLLVSWSSVWAQPHCRKAICRQSSCCVALTCTECSSCNHECERPSPIPTQTYPPPTPYPPVPTLPATTSATHIGIVDSKKQESKVDNTINVTNRIDNTNKIDIPITVNNNNVNIISYSHRSNATSIIKPPAPTAPPIIPTAPPTIPPYPTPTTKTPITSMTTAQPPTTHTIPCPPPYPYPYPTPYPHPTPYPYPYPTPYPYPIPYPPCIPSVNHHCSQFAHWSYRCPPCPPCPPCIPSYGSSYYQKSCQSSWHYNPCQTQCHQQCHKDPCIG